jgi:hypothetical protein
MRAIGKIPRNLWWWAWFLSVGPSITQSLIMKLIQPLFGSLSLVLLATSAAPAQEAAPTPAPATEQAANPAADLQSAVEKLAAAKSYAWSQTASFGNMEPRTTSGKKGSGGFLYLNLPGRDQPLQVLVHKGKAALQNDGGWTAAESLASGEGQGPGRFIARMIQNSQEPVVEAKELLGKATDLKAEDGKFSGTLNEEAARSLMTFGGPRRGGNGGGGGGGNFPEVSGAGGSVTFTVSNGVLSSYEIKLTGKMNFNGEEREVNRTSKVEFSGVGSTSFDIPEAAAGLLVN